MARALAKVLQHLLMEPGVPDDVATKAVAQLARSPEPWARVDAARDRRCPPAVVTGLAADWWWEVRAAVASRPGLPRLLALVLAHDESEWVRRTLAENPDTHPDALRQLHDDLHLGVRDAVAEHPATPHGTLLAMVEDPAWEIRRSLAKRRHLPADVLIALSRDPEHWVRFFVACHPATPDWVRRELADDPRPTVRAVAVRMGERARGAALMLGRGIEPHDRPNHPAPPEEGSSQH
jgi:hypothetical protein